LDSAAAFATDVDGISSSKDYCAYPDLIFYYAAPSAIHLYANPRKAGVAIADPRVDFARRPLSVIL
jgi:hypothetical protein